jgi:hypothetical protein
MILTAVPDGDAGTAETIEQYIRPLVAEGVRSPIVRGLALQFLADYGAQPHDKIGEMRAIFDGVRDHFQFREDPAITTRLADGRVVEEGAEMVQPAEGIIGTGVGDCDCLNGVLLPSLLGSVGFATRVVTIKADSARPDEFSHIYMEAQDPDSGAWLALDVARSDPQFGKEPEYFWERKEWPMTGAPRHLNGYGLGTIGPVSPPDGSMAPFRGMGRLGRGMGRAVSMRISARRFPRRGLGQDPSEAPLMSVSSDLGDDLDSYSNPSLDAYNQGLTNSVTAFPSSSSSNNAALLQATPAILQGIAQVTKAANTPGIAYSGVGTPATTAAAPGVSMTGSSGWVVLIVIAVIGIAAFNKKG